MFPRDSYRRGGPLGHIAAAIAIAAFAVGAAGAGTAAADPGRGDFDAAAAKLSAGNPRAAADAFVAMADAHPDSVFADDAVFAAAELFEERLSQPQTATRLYQRLVNNYPDSRNARAASRRLADLGPLLVTGSEALARFTTLKNERANIGPRDAIERARQLLVAHPEWAGAPDVALWIADELMLEGDVDGAIVQYDLVVSSWPGSRAARTASVTREEAWAERDRNRRRSAMGTAGLTLYLGCLLSLAISLALGAGSLRAAATAVVRPPTEAIYLLPVAAVLAAAAQAGYQPAADAVTQICIGGIVITWLSGCGLTVAPGRLRSIAHAGLCVVAVLALCLFAVDRSDLFDVLGETLRHGPDR